MTEEQRNELYESKTPQKKAMANIGSLFKSEVYYIRKYLL